MWLDFNTVITIITVIILQIGANAMARQIVTQQAVNEAAEALMVEGSEPSILSVQSRIGGGSYSTVKRFLDVWKQARAQAATAAPDTPPEVQAKGQEFARAVWTLASLAAQRELQQAKDDAKAEVATVRGELAETTTEITRLEGVEAAQAAIIEQQQARLRDVELALAQAQTQAHRVPELEKSLDQIRTELDACRKDYTEKAVEAGRLAGEAQALHAEVRELMAVIKPPTQGNN
jgi:chromosome segregation ATPase